MMDITNAVVAITGVDATTLMGGLALISIIARPIGKAIPDTAKGPLGILRKVAKVVGLYNHNRVTPRLHAGDAIEITSISAQVEARPIFGDAYMRDESTAAGDYDAQR